MTSYSGDRHKYKINFIKCVRDDCYEYFIFENDLNDHMRKDHQVYKNRCPIADCPRSFRSVHLLHEHAVRHHSEMTLFRCTQCDEVMSTFWFLKLHYYFSHEEGSFSCTVPGCNFKNAYRNVVIEHYDYEHRDIEAKSKEAK